MNKVGFIGCGNMGKAMLAGALKSGFISCDDVIVHTKSKSSLEELNDKYGVVMGSDNKEVAKNARMIVLAVKPNIYQDVIGEIKELVSSSSIIIAIAPSFSIDALDRLFNKNVKIVRAMPNTPAMVGCGISGISFSSNITDEEKKEVIEFFNCSGEAIEIKEDLMKAVGSVSGSSPAFIYMLIEAMADGAVLMGIPRKDAYRFAAKAVEGTARMVLETGKHPGELKDAVCSPGGTTIEGVIELEKNGFKGNIIQAMIQSADKFQRMQDEATTK
jgi:pyrroline-5-carboxylate reductase